MNQCVKSFWFFEGCFNVLIIFCVTSHTFWANTNSRQKFEERFWKVAEELSQFEGIFFICEGKKNRYKGYIFSTFENSCHSLHGNSKVLIFNHSPCNDKQNNMSLMSLAFAKVTSVTWEKQVYCTGKIWCSAIYDTRAMSDMHLKTLFQRYKY